MPEIETFAAYTERQRAIGSAPSWQITPTADVHRAVIQAEHDRMAQDGPDAATPQGGYPLTPHQGSTIPNPKLAIVYLGQFWGDTAKLEAFAGDLMTAGYLAPLAKYGYGSGNGTFIGAFHGPAVSGTVTDAQLQVALSSLIAAGTVPKPDGHTLYALIIPDGVTVDQGGSASCSAFCGYHGKIDAQTFYSVQTSPACSGCLPPGDAAFNVFTAVLAHEVAEACTDAIPGQGWYNDQTGMENADEWAWIFGAYGPWIVQGYQINGVGNSLNVIAYQQQSPPPVQYALTISGPLTPQAGQSAVYSSTLTPHLDTATYQWFANGVAIPGGQTANVTLTKAGPLALECRATVAPGTVVAAQLTVQVQPAPSPQPCPACRSVADAQAQNVLAWLANQAQVDKQFASFYLYGAACVQALQSRQDGALPV